MNFKRVAAKAVMRIFPVPFQTGSALPRPESWTKYETSQQPLLPLRNESPRALCLSVSWLDQLFIGRKDGTDADSFAGAFGVRKPECWVGRTKTCALRALEKIHLGRIAWV